MEKRRLERGAAAMIVIDPEIRIARGALPRRALSGFAREVKDAVALQGRVSIFLTDDVRIRRLNKQYRRKDKATDVLSFPAAQADGNRVVLAGDLAISLETAQRQADEHGHSLVEEVRILLLHGMLHLKGLDHETDSGQMARKERSLRRKFALPLGLIQRTEVKPPVCRPLERAAGPATRAASR
jgi:probable rRNA maturation factor